VEVRNSPIGVFDSGLGGLTVVKQIKKLLPKENIVYFGDTARLPYGSKSNETVRKYSLEIARFLEKKGVKLIVVACNTSSSVALDLLSQEISVPVIGVVKPACKKAVSVTKSGNIGVIGTRATMNSGAYKDTISSMNSKIKVIQKECPLFVPLVEEGMTDGEIVEMVVRYYLESLRGEIDTLILGCTHYPIIKHVIAKYVDGDVRIIDSSVEVAREVHELLKREGILSKGETAREDAFYVSDFPQRFEEMAKLFTGENLKRVGKIYLE